MKRKSFVTPPPPKRRSKIDRSWIHIGTLESLDDYANFDELPEYQDIPTDISKKPSPMITTLEIQAEAYEKVRRLSLEHEMEKKGHLSHLDVHTHPGQVTTTLPLEWYTFRIGSLGVGFDLEMWWRKCANFLRLHVIFIVLLFIIFLVHLIAGVVFVVLHFTQTVRSPYVCETKECMAASQYLSKPMNMSVDPCDNFYEFMCGNYTEEQVESLKYAKLLSDPGFRLELGEPSLLSKILKDFRQDPTYDQSIRYYQSCLDEENKKFHGIKALLDRMEYIFGTRDFNAFNSGTEVMEQVATRLYQVVGHAFYLNMAFSTFPYIQLMPLTVWTSYLLYYTRRNYNELYVRKVYNYLLPNFGLQADSPEVEELVKATGIWGETLLKIQLDTTRIDFSQPNGIRKLEDSLKARVRHRCPPMGIRLNMTMVLNEFLQTTEWKEEYYDNTTRMYWHAIRWCFEYQEEFKWANAGLTPQWGRLSFVSIWLLGLFEDAVEFMDREFIYNYTEGITEEQWKNVPLVGYRYETGTKIDIEYKCLNELWTSLGYLPSLRYLSANVPNPVDYLNSNEDEIRKLYKKTRHLFSQIPQEEIHPFMLRQGELMFRRELQPEILMPLTGDTLDTFRDHLDFTEDHLHNHYVALNLTIQSGRHYWYASTDRLKAPKWWGYGGTISLMSDLLLDLRAPFIHPARYKEMRGAFTAGEWDTFLGRNDFNYILYPLSLYNEPHVSETLALKSAGSTLKIIRSLLTLIGRISEDVTLYPYFMDYSLLREEQLYLKRRAEMRENGGNGYNEYPIDTSAQCNTLEILRLGREKDYINAHAFKYGIESHVIQQVSNNDYPEHLNFFLNVMALKFAFKHLLDTRKGISGLSYDADLSEDARNFRIRRLLPGKMEKYSEEQLFFMAFTRHLCLQSWKNCDDATNSTAIMRYALEIHVLNLLANSEEFKKAFKCKGRSLMNNRGQPSCFKWVP